MKRTLGHYAMLAFKTIILTGWASVALWAILALNAEVLAIGMMLIYFAITRPQLNETAHTV